MGSSTEPLNYSNGVAVGGNYGYFSYVANSSGVKIFNTGVNPSVISEVGNYALPDTYTFGVAATNNYLYISTTGTLKILDISNNNSAKPIWLADYPISSYSLAINNQYAYVVGTDGLTILDLKNPSNPSPVSNYKTAGNNPIYGVDVKDNYAYLAIINVGLQIIDVSNRQTPVLVGKFDLPEQTRGISIAGTNAFVANGKNGLLVFNISDPIKPVLIARYDNMGQINGVTVGSNTSKTSPQKVTRLYLANNEKQFTEWDYTDENAITEQCAIFNTTLSSVDVSCVRVNSIPYAAKLNAVPNNEGKLQFTLDTQSFHPVTIFPITNLIFSGFPQPQPETCGVFPYGSNNLLRLNCLNVNGQKYWAELSLSNLPSGILFDVSEFGVLQK
ncbi:MAG: hypothetical protein RIT27_1690 [Pseudomonadota bacterium]